LKFVNFRRVLLITGLSSLVIIYAILWLRMINSQSERTGSDFIAFYAAGIIAQNQGMAHVYDLNLQQAVEQEQVGFALAPGQVLPYNHVPYLVPLLSVLVSGDYVASFIRWTIFMSTIFVIGVGILVWWFHCKGFDKHTILVISAGILTFFPFFVSLMHGQDTSLLFLGTCLWLLGLLSGRDSLAGSGLALMTVRPQIALMLAIPFLFKKQKVFGWFCLGAGAFSIISLFILGVEGMRSFIDILLVTAGGEWYGMNQSAMVNLIGLLLRLFPGLSVESVRVIGWVVYGLTMVGLCLLWRRSRVIDERQITLAVILALSTSPHLHYHDLTLLLVPLLALILVLARGGFLSNRNIGFVPLVVSIILLFGSLIPVLKYNLPVLMMVLIVLLTWFPGKFFCRTGLPREEHDLCKP
jgi:hypothetical protein